MMSNIEPFSHKQQIQFLEHLKNNSNGIMDRKIIQDIIKSVLDSKSRARDHAGRINMDLPLERYRYYMDFIVSLEQQINLPKAKIVLEYSRLAGVDIKGFDDVVIKRLDEIK